MVLKQLSVTPCKSVVEICRRQRLMNAEVGMWMWEVGIGKLEGGNAKSECGM